MYKGIDVSKWQGEIDWQKVKNSGVEFAILRAGYGWGKDQHDKYFEVNYNECKKVGLPVGCYHYSYATSISEAVKEAEYLYSLIKGKQFEYPIVYDLEEQNTAILGKEMVSAIADAFCKRLESYGYYVCIYANKHWLTNYFTDDIFNQYDIWLAEWKTKPTFKKPFGMWQYSASGKVSGIAGDVDLNESYKDYPSIMKKHKLNGFDKKTVTPETTFKKGDKVRVINPISYDTGKKFKLWHSVYEVLQEPKNDRCVIGVNGVVTSAVNVNDITKV